MKSETHWAGIREEFQKIQITTWVGRGHTPDPSEKSLSRISPNHSSSSRGINFPADKREIHRVIYSAT